MISLLNFIDTGFIITLGLLLLVSGAVMLYSYRRLNILENSLIEHGKILQNFIVNYNNHNQFLVNQQSQFGSLESISNTNINLQNKNRISVSDDENDEDDDNEYETDNDNEESDENLHEESSGESDRESDEESDEESQKDNNDINEKDILFKHDTFDLKNEQDSEDVFFTNLPINLNELNLDSKIIKLETSETELETSEKVNEKKNYSRMKVDELRSLVVTKDLKSNEDAQKMQKKDLLKLLQ
tara:strand:+ start:23 stop:751 length:729 start_codon:yes stop_codon:yes gene_type:complete